MLPGGKAVEIRNVFTFADSPLRGHCVAFKMTSGGVVHILYLTVLHCSSVNFTWLFCLWYQVQSLMQVISLSFEHTSLCSCRDDMHGQIQKVVGGFQDQLRKFSGYTRDMSSVPSFQIQMFINILFPGTFTPFAAKLKTPHG